MRVLLLRMEVRRVYRRPRWMRVLLLPANIVLALLEVLLLFGVEVELEKASQVRRRRGKNDAS